MSIEVMVLYESALAIGSLYLEEMKEGCLHAAVLEAGMRLKLLFQCAWYSPVLLPKHVLSLFSDAGEGHRARVKPLLTKNLPNVAPGPSAASPFRNNPRVPSPQHLPSTHRMG